MNHSTYHISAADGDLGVHQYEDSFVYRNGISHTVEDNASLTCTYALSSSEESL